MNGLSLPWWIHAAGFASLAAQMIAFLRALVGWRAKPWASGSAQPLTRLWPTLGLLSVGLILPAATVGFIEPGRKALIALGLGPYNPDLAYYHLDPEPWARYHVLFCAVIWALPGALLATSALTLALSARWKTLAAGTTIGPTRQLTPPRQPPSTLEVGAMAFSFFLFSVLPLLSGIWFFDQRLQRTFDMATGLSPGEKESFILGGFATATRALRLGATTGAIGLGLAFMIAVLLMRRWQKQGLLFAQAEGHSKRSVFASGLVLIIAIGVVGMTKPLRDENRMPWPELSRTSVRVWPALPGDFIAQNRPVSTLRFHSPLSGEQEPLPFPLLQGTEEGANLTTTLSIAAGIFRVNDVPTDAADLRETLRTAKNNRSLLYPGDSRDRIALLAMPDITGRLIEDGLGAAYDAGFRELDLVSGRLETIRRPMLGLVSRSLLTTTPTKIHRLAPSEDAGSGPGRLACGLFANYQELLSAVIRKERMGEDVVLALPQK